MDLVPSFVSDLIAGLVGTAIVGASAILTRILGPGAGRRLTARLRQLGWPFAAFVFLAVALTSAVVRGGTVSIVVLGALLLLSASFTLLRLGPDKLLEFVPAKVRPVAMRLRAYSWRILAGIFFLSSVTLLALNLGSSSPSVPCERITFVVSLDDTEMLVFRDILDELEPELGAQVFLMNVDSSRYVSRLDKMRAAGDMKWDLIAVDNNMLGVLAAKDLVEELPVDEEYLELVPESLMLSLRPLLRFEGTFYFAPFRPNVKIAYYNEEKFAQYNLEPPRDWEELLEVARVFREEEDVGRVAIQGEPGAATAVTLFEFVRAAGGDPLTLDDDGATDAVTFLQRLESYLAPEYKETTFNTANEFLIDDVVYLVDNWTFGIGVVVEDAGKKEIKAYSGWSGPKGEVHVLGGDVLAVPKGAAHSDTAIKLIKLLLSKETQQTMLSRLRWLPVRLDAYDGVPPEIAPYFEAVREAIARAEARPTEPQWTLAENILDRAFQGLIRDGEDIELLEKYAKMLKEIPTEFIRYTVKDGDTVESIAVKFNTMSDIIHEANCMTAGTSIGPGQILLVPDQ